MKNCFLGLSRGHGAISEFNFKTHFHFQSGSSISYSFGPFGLRSSSQSVKQFTAKRNWTSQWVFAVWKLLFWEIKIFGNGFASMWQSRAGKGMYDLWLRGGPRIFRSLSKPFPHFSRRNPDKQPIIIVDGVAYQTFKKVLCASDRRYFSGELNRFDNMLQNWHSELKDLGVQIVFFRSWGVVVHKAYEWMNMENKRFKESEQFYEWIEEGRSAPEIFNGCHELEASLLYSLMVNYAPITSQFADHKLSSFGRDADQNIARFARTNDVLAVLTVDTDFMIFDGNWKLWSFTEIDLDGFMVTEYDRLMLNGELMLTF